MNSKLDRIAEWADHEDFSASIENAARLDEPAEVDPMVSTSLRMPKSLMDWVREQAAAESMRPTAWIRRLIEQQRDHGDLARRVERLERLVEK